MRRLIRALAAAVVAVGVLAAPATATAAPTVPAVDIIPGDPLGCDTQPPMSAPNTGVLSLDPGPEKWGKGDPFAANPTVSAYEVYGYAGMEWPNYDLGCGPDALRNTDATIGGAVANFLWNGLLGTAAAVTAVQRWTYDPDTLDVLEPVQLVAAEALGNRVFMPLFGLTMLGAAAFILFRARKGNVREGANHTGWVLVVTALAMGCILWPAKIAPIADEKMMSVLSTVNSAVAGGTSGQTVSIADTNAANIQHGVLYSTWTSGVFGRSSGATVEKYGPILFQNAALTRDEAKLLETDPAAAQKIIDEKKDRFIKAAEDLKGEDPIAYDYLAGKHNWSRMWYALAGWLAFLCSMAYLLLASLLLLYAMLVIRIAVMLTPLLAVAAVYWPWRRILIRVLDYVAGAVAAAVMFGCAAAIFTAILGAIMSPTTNTPILLAAILMGAVTVAGLYLTKPLKHARAFAMPGLDRFRRSDQPEPPPQQAPIPPTPAESYTRPPTASATYRHSFARSVTTGLVQGATAGATMAAITGGTSVVAGATTGAARGAATEGVAAATGSATAAALAGAGAAKALPPGRSTGTPAAAPKATPAVHPEVPMQDVSARRVVAGERVWQPGEANPAAALTPTVPERGVYPIFQPVPVKEQR